MDIWQIINTALFWTGLYILLWYAYILLMHKAVPNIKTAPAIRRFVIDHIKNLHADSPIRILDMGCSNGVFSCELAKSLPNAQIIGIDISPVSIAISRLRSRLMGLNNTKFIQGDFMAHDCTPYDVIYIYLTIYQMEDLGKKLHTEPGANRTVFCNRFALGDGWKPVGIQDIETLLPHQKNIHIYKG